MGGDATTSETLQRERQVPGFLSPFINQGVGAAEGALGNLGGILSGATGADLVAGFDPLQIQAQQQLIDLAGGAGGFLPTAEQALLETARGDFLFGGPAFDAAVNASLDLAQPRIASAFGLAGGANDPLAGVALQREASNAFASLFNQERARQLGAAQALPGIAQIGPGLLEGIGADRRALEQARIQAPITAEQTLLQAALSGLPVENLLGETTFLNQTLEGDDLLGTIGGALAGGSALAQLLGLSGSGGGSGLLGGLGSSAGGALGDALFGAGGGGGGLLGSIFGGGGVSSDLDALIAARPDLFGSSGGGGLGLGGIGGLGGTGLTGSVAPSIGELGAGVALGTAPLALGSVLGPGAAITAPGLASAAGAAGLGIPGGTIAGGIGDVAAAAAASQAAGLGGAGAFASFLGGMAPLAGIAALPLILGLGGKERTPEQAGELNTAQGATLLGAQIGMGGTPDVPGSFAAMDAAVVAAVGPEMAALYHFLQDPSGGLGVTEDTLRAFNNPQINSILAQAPRFSPASTREGIIPMSPQDAAMLIRPLPPQTGGFEELEALRDMARRFEVADIPMPPEVGVRMQELEDALEGGAE